MYEEGHAHLLVSAESTLHKTAADSLCACVYMRVHVYVCMFAWVQLIIYKYTYLFAYTIVLTYCH